MCAANRRPSAGWLAAAQHELAAASERGDAAPHSVAAWAAVLSALAKCGAVERRCSKAALADTAQQLQSAPAPAVAQMLWAVAKARATPSPSWLRGLRAALERGAPDLSAPQLAGCLRSLAFLADRVDEGELRGTAARLAEQLALRPGGGGAGPGELSQALWALARCVCVGGVWGESFRRVLSPGFKGLAGVGLCMVLSQA
jgi:hypothetical protein